MARRAPFHRARAVLPDVERSAECGERPVETDHPYSPEGALCRPCREDLDAAGAVPGRQRPASTGT